MKSRKQYLEEQDKAYLELALSRANGCVSAAAKLIGVSRAAFYKLMRQRGIAVPNQELSRATRRGLAQLTTQRLLARLARPRHQPLENDKCESC